MSLSVSEQFVLLAHELDGGCVFSGDYAGAAELADFVLWQRVEIFGGQVRILDVRPTGLAWFDGGLAVLRSFAGARNKPVPAHKYILARSPIRAGKASALATHRASLMHRDYARCVQKRTLGVFPRQRYYPNPDVWHAALGELRAFARNELGPDNRLLLLAALTYATALTRSLPLTDTERAQLRRISESTDLGVAVRAFVASSA
ncbi:GPP34 family phosphoprotein [Saccharopolyspora sp. K220]|uniref:GPP34 family phosphoprotein n=1 Tax=Saccharopolyspora soli TaxID=2926618 RepID=UPI001F5A9736|nr:GPP34 family phosphoprotein [Saccharopolyspora soli]MCI2423609.1 GPP34 family phosphoprotein [Saccharopolyspora soli]